MLGALKKLLPICLFTLLLANVSLANSPFNFGGEIPWPLSIQHVVTVQNSKGLWRVQNKDEKRLYNVEMRRDPVSGFDWIRISELDHETYQVKSWGEGLFSNKKYKDDWRSSFSSIALGFQMFGRDRYGRYITMFPNGEFDKHPFVIRMVEVDTALGTVLGLSMFEFSGERKYEHFLGSRLLDEPLECVENERTESLSCYVDYMDF